MEKINIGKIVNAVGLKGELKVYNYSAYKERFEELEYVYVEEKKAKIDNVRYMKEMVILKLADVNDRNQAEALKNSLIYIDETQLRELPEGEYYIKDMIGMAVKEEKGNVLGVLTDVIQNSAQDLYEVEMADGKKALIPAVSEFVKDIDMEKREIIVNVIEGLI